MKRIYQLYFILFLGMMSLISSAQPNENWDQEKISGKRYILPEPYDGTPFYINDWVEGTVTFKSGEEISGLKIKYDGLLDELIYINELFHSMVIVEKERVESFRFAHLGKEYLFEQRYFDGLFAGNRFFQVYHKGTVDLVCYRNVELITTTAYKDRSGRMKNMEYQNVHRYYLFSPEYGYRTTNLKKRSLLRHLSKADAKEAKRLLRGKSINWGTPEAFSGVLSLLDKNNLPIQL